jgi:hypothetical protein
MIAVKTSGSFKFVQLRNPWGNSVEWNGDWSDGSGKWAEHPQVQDDLNFEPEDDGLFWMEWNAFVSTYDTIEVQMW